MQVIAEDVTARAPFERRNSNRRIDLRTALEWREPERRKLERRSMELPEGLSLLDLPQPGFGFRCFISSWFFVDALGRRILVDPGPASTVPLLVDSLSRITSGVDIVLLTHIHLDHSGGVAQLCRTFGGAKVLVHPKGRRHLLEPGKLWKASLETLGEVAEMYGEPLPLPPESLLDDNDLPDVTILETPGHAPHHLSFIARLRNERLFFLGEAAGLYLPMASTPTLPWLRPTTPPKFDGAAALESLDKIAHALQGDELLCYSHWGAAQRSRQMIALARGQLAEWISTIERLQSQSEETIADYLLTNDALLSGYMRLSSDLRERERLFIRNSIRGILDYVKSK